MGGKSRKSGGISKKLIAQIREGSCGSASKTLTTHEKIVRKGLFDLDEEDEPET
jgi:hypothetical protein